MCASAEDVTRCGEATLVLVTGNHVNRETRCSFSGISLYLFRPRSPDPGGPDLLEYYTPTHTSTSPHITTDSVNSSQTTPPNMIC